jgi:hypothetical protein
MTAAISMSFKQTTGTVKPTIFSQVNYSDTTKYRNGTLRRFRSLDGNFPLILAAPDYIIVGGEIPLNSYQRLTSIIQMVFGRQIRPKNSLVNH